LLHEVKKDECFAHPFCSVPDMSALMQLSLSLKKENKSKND